KAVELDPDCATATMYVAWTLPGLSGEGLMAHAVELAKNVPAAERMFIEAHAAIFANDADKAKQLLGQVAEAKPRDPRPLIELAWLTSWDEDFDASIAAAKKIVALDPKNPLGHNMLALALSDAGRVDEAMAEAGQQIKLLSEEPNPHDTLGEIM